MSVFGPTHGRPCVTVDFDQLSELDSRTIEAHILGELRTHVGTDLSKFPWPSLTVLLGGASLVFENSKLIGLISSNDDDVHSTLESNSPDLVVDICPGQYPDAELLESLHWYPGNATIVLTLNADTFNVDQMRSSLRGRSINVLIQYVSDGSEDGLDQLLQRIAEYNDTREVGARRISPEQVWLTPQVSNYNIVAELALSRGLCYSPTPIGGIFARYINGNEKV